jgi:hypothetical protein
LPTQKELVSNKPLSGPELAEIIKSDVARMLEGSGFTAGQTAYSRVGYELRLTLHLGLFGMSTSEDAARSRTQAADVVQANSALAALEPFPLADPDPVRTVLESTQMARDIESPNLARVEHSLPVTVDVKGQDGHTREELVTYTPSDVGMKAEEFPLPDLTDVTPVTKKELGL